RTLTIATMRPLILLATVMCCSAQLVYHTGYPWAPLTTPLLTAAKIVEGEELKTVSLASPYLASPYLHHPYHAALPLTYSVKLPEPTLEATEFPYIYTEKEELSRRKRHVSPLVLPYAHHTLPYAHHTLPYALPYASGLLPHTGLLPYSGLHAYAGAHPFNTFGLGLQHLGPVIKIDQEAEAEEEEASSRRRRDVTVKLPYLHAVPTTKKVTVETKVYEGVDAATPADTKLIELTTKEHEVDVPAVKYVQPVLKYKPVTYTAHSVVPYAGLHAGLYSGLHAGLPYSGLSYSGLPLTYSGLHPFGLTPYSSVLKVESSDE
ncbi:unnamed protein product, partial [Meganyctiphanes norvegica]